jgi:hypothetical protein
MIDVDDTDRFRTELEDIYYTPTGFDSTVGNSSLN